MGVQGRLVGVVSALQSVNSFLVLNVSNGMPSGSVSRFL